MNPKKALLEHINELKKQLEEKQLQQDCWESEQIQRINRYQKTIDDLRDEITFLKTIIKKLIRED